MLWLKPTDDFRGRLAGIQSATDPQSAWASAALLADSRLTALQTTQLDTVVQAMFSAESTDSISAPEARIALLSSCTTSQLHAGIRVAGLRRNLRVILFEAEYGQYLQELMNPSAALQEFRPTHVLIVLDAHHVSAGVNTAFSPEESESALDEILDRVSDCWRLAQAEFGCTVIHQTPLPVLPPLMGSNEHRLPGSKAAFISRFNHRLRERADQANVQLLAIDERMMRDGVQAWHNPALWWRAKQEISPNSAPLYGDLLVRIIAALRGASSKCLVLDLDNTLWGGVIGDDGMGGIVLGPGTALGEAYAAFQAYAQELSKRGVILAVSSKNDEVNVIEAFENHPEMVLKRDSIASIKANWSDKAENIKAIALELNIGLDSLVFVDDNPFERELIRRELPAVRVPEVGDDPSNFPNIISDAGYFESVSVTADDRKRRQQYQLNKIRNEEKSSSTDILSYLRGLQMHLEWKPFDQIGLGRIAQLVNKTNQFNVTTCRYTEQELRAMMDDPRIFTLQLRLRDRLGDSGMIGVVIGREIQPREIELDTWLMSCRVLGRQVEVATLNLIVEEARRRQALTLRGVYRRTEKNGMVEDLYGRLGFTRISAPEVDASIFQLHLADFRFTKAEIETSKA